MKRIIASLISLFFAATALAHTHLESASPADKSTVPSAKAIELHFSGEARLTSLSLQKGSAEAKNLAVPSKASRDYSIAVPELGAGTYKVSWRVVGDDGHVMAGSFGFTIDPQAATPAADAGSERHH